jgi:acyl dehydratase
MHERTAPAPRLWFEDFPTGHVTALGPHGVDGEEMLAFSRRFDPQPFHLDEAAAAASLFGGLAASGWYTAACTMRLLCDAYLLESASLGAPGVEELRWPRPVFAGDTLTGTVTVLDTRVSRSRPEMGLVHNHTEMRNQHGETVFSMKSWGMFRRRAAG